MWGYYFLFVNVRTGPRSVRYAALTLVLSLDSAHKK